MKSIVYYKDQYIFNYYNQISEKSLLMGSYEFLDAMPLSARMFPLTCNILSSSRSLNTVPLIWLGLRAVQLNTGRRNFVFIGFLILIAEMNTGTDKRYRRYHFMECNSILDSMVISNLFHNVIFTRQTSCEDNRRWGRWKRRWRRALACSKNEMVICVYNLYAYKINLVCLSET